ncbi:MAG TPA: hypothetical protein D7H74_01975 [Candidatus Poseidoniales archaeon]|nr:MAG TPA: hypothetical protein D7H74_01975 [Candidatus Poseidoniales archaeon]
MPTVITTVALAVESSGQLWSVSKGVALTIILEESPLLEDSGTVTWRTKVTSLNASRTTRTDPEGPSISTLHEEESDSASRRIVSGLFPRFFTFI